MTRSVTAAKLWLLTLIELYCSDVVPARALVPILSFIAVQITEYRPAKSPLEHHTGSRTTIVSLDGLVINVKDFETLLSAYPSTHGIPGRKLWDNFLLRLWSISSLDDLHVFFDRIGALLMKTKDEVRLFHEAGVELPTGIMLSRNSVFGTFVRHSHVEFTRLQFHDTSKLWEEFVMYRQRTVPYLVQRNSNFNRRSYDRILLTGEHNGWEEKDVAAISSVVYGLEITDLTPKACSTSLDEIESLLEFQIEQMQIYGNRTPQRIQREFRRLLVDSCLNPSLAHYLTFLDSWRAGDYFAAFEGLHRYFDYTMHSRNQFFYQYALMNLAVLQADFGCHKESMAAMMETVSTARENRDMICLNFALHWLYQFGRHHPTLFQSSCPLPTGSENLAFLSAQAKESGMWTLWISVLLSEARSGFACGDSMAISIEYLVRSSHLLVERNMTNMFGSQLALLSALWDRLGLSSLSLTTCSIFRHCHAPLSMFEDELKIASRLAFHFSAKGGFEKGLEILRTFEDNSLRSFKPRMFWHKARAIIKLQRDLHHHDLDGAEQFLSQLLQSNNDSVEPDLSSVVHYLHIEYMIRRGDFRAAFSLVENILDRLRAGGKAMKDVVSCVRLLILKSDLFERCGRPQRGLTMAVRAASLAWQARLIPCLWHAIGSLSRILISLGEFPAAAQLLTTILPRVLECDSSILAAKLYSLLADANMGLAGSMPSGSSKRTEFMMRALVGIQKAYDFYSSLGDVLGKGEMMSKKATIMSLGKELDLAAGCAASYVFLRKELRSESFDR